MNEPVTRAAQTTPPSPADPQPAAPGLAGAPRLAWPEGLARINAGARVLIGCDLEIARRFGDNNPGAASHIRQRTCDLPAPADAWELGPLIATATQEAFVEIGQCVAAVAERGATPLLVACDHTASFSAYVGIAETHGSSPIYLYFDAHHDLGRICRADDLLHNGGFVAEMLQGGWAKRVINIGGRSLVTRLPYPDIPGFENLAGSTEVDHLLAPLRGQTLYVSIDADVLDPREAPNVCCPEEAGMSAATLLACCAWLGQHCRVLGADLCEVLPSPFSRDCERTLISALLSLAPPR